MKILKTDGFPIVLGLIILFVIFSKLTDDRPGTQLPMMTSQTVALSATKASWQPPDTLSLGNSPEDQMIKYGRDLIVHTSYYLGAKGTVATFSNGLNCQNCHLDAGARPFGNALTDVAATYPRYRNRSGRIESIEFRVNDCMKRSMNGRPLDSLSREMRAIVAYLKWLGNGFPKDEEDAPVWNSELPPYMDRAADPGKGQTVYQLKCVVCHGRDGQGMIKPDSTGYTYPPLWGPHSYNTGAGLYRLGSFAAYAWYNMPFGSTQSNHQLSPEEAWDVAAFVNSQPRPEKEFREDWPDLKSKAIDHPYGPYADNFPEKQHKFGPFKPILEARKKRNAK